MLAAAHRLRRGEDFRRTVRRGVSASRSTLTVHLLAAPSAPAPPAADLPSQVGFVVGRDVGGAVERTRVTRRLRHLVREHLAELPAGSTLVVRARPGAAGASAADLGRDLDEALERALSRARRRAPSRDVAS